jgi:hypothetical protein
VNEARKIEASIASVAPVVVIGPSATVPVVSDATLRFALPRVLLSVSWVVAMVGYHFSKHHSHWGYRVSVRPSENLVFIKHTFVSLLII